jgi:transcriptional regulator with XRE-family HTH domain
MFDIRRALRNYMDERGLKQAYLSRECAMRSDSVSRVLNGKRELKVSELMTICRVLGVTVEELSQYDGDSCRRD